VYHGGQAKDVHVQLAKGEQVPEDARTRARDEFLLRGLSDELQKSLREDFNEDGALYVALQRWLEKESVRAGDSAYPAAFRKDIEEVQQYASNIRYS
jgi:hypothetical protein